MTALSPSSTPDTHSGLVPRHLRVARKRRSRRRWMVRSCAIVVVISFLAMPLALALRGSGLKSALVRRFAPAYAPLEHPTVTASRPGHEDSSVPCDAFIAVDVQLPNSG